MVRRATHTSSVALLFVVACTADGTLRSADNRVTQALEPLACMPTGAHEVHEALPLVTQCKTCHACGGAFEIFPLALPRGTTLSGAQIHRGPPASCTVACHFPLGGAPVEVAWDEPGPFACTRCHGVLDEAGGDPVVSDHGVSTSSVTANRAGCQSCHVSGSHLGGRVLVDLGNGTVVDTSVSSVDEACQSCHSGAATRTLGDATAPRLPDYAALTGDFHGARAGSGYGGTLKAPYARAQAPLSCPSCHATHASGNPYLLAALVNNEPVAAGITTSGIGAERLCEACHTGDRHAGCRACHGSDPAPSGATCFFCHGHEGIVSFPWPDVQRHPHGTQGPGCTHCHSPGWMAPPETTPPALHNLTTSDIRPNSITIDWQTNEKATTYVEYGLTGPIASSGSAALVYTHHVVLSGLSPATTYSYRVRSTDALRNVAQSLLSTFTTAREGAPAAPALVDNLGYASWSDAAAPLTLAWSAVSAPSGAPAQYRVVVATSAAFTTLLYDSGFTAATSYAVNVPCTSYCDSAVPYYWRVVARDGATLIESPWSSVDTFSVCWWTDADW